MEEYGRLVDSVPPNRGFRVVVGSFVTEYQNLSAEITYDNQLVANISAERGYDHLEIELASKPDGSNWFFELDEFEAVLKEAVNRMKRL